MKSVYDFDSDYDWKDYLVSEILEMKELLNRQVLLISATVLKSEPCLHEVPVVVYLLDD